MGSASINGTGNDKANKLVGNKSNNNLRGFGGKDILTGGGGADTLTGGSGADTFTYKSLSDSSGKLIDTITDYSSNDKIDLSAIDSNPLLSGRQSFSVFNSRLPVQTTNQLRFDASTETHKASLFRVHLLHLK